MGRERVTLTLPTRARSGPSPQLSAHGVREGMPSGAIALLQRAVATSSAGPSAPPLYWSIQFSNEAQHGRGGRAVQGVGAAAADEDRPREALRYRLSIREDETVTGSARGVLRSSL